MPQARVCGHVKAFARKGRQRLWPEHPPPMATRAMPFYRLLLASLLLACSLLQTAWAQACPPTIAAVHIAKEPAGAAARPSQGWEPVTLPFVWTTLWPDYSGVAWYRLSLRQDCVAGQENKEPLALMVSSINMAGEVYLNDTLLWRDASLQDPLSRSWNTPRYWILPEAAMHAGDNAIWIRVQGRALVFPGIGRVRLGPLEQMRALHARVWWSTRTIYEINLIGSLFIAALFGGIWLLYRKQAVYGWFALLNLSWAAFVYNVVATTPWPFSDVAGMFRANAIAFMVFCSSYVIFSSQLCGRSLSRREQGSLLTLTGALSLLILLTPEKPLQPLTLASELIHLLMFGLACLTPLARVWRSRSRDALLHALVGLAFMLIAAYDAHTYFSYTPEPALLTPYVNLITMALITCMLSARVAASMRSTERFNVELTQAVEQACRELETTLDKEYQTALSNSRLQERLQFIHDLHDGFGSALVRAIVQAERTENGQADASRHVSTLKSLRDDLRNVMDGGRTAKADTPATPAEWLAPTRHRFSTLFDELEVDSHWSCLAAWPRPPSVALCLELTRLLEEALSNVLKHSAATEVAITLAANADGALVLEVRDNGVGFDTSAISHQVGGIGLNSMQARVDRLGGQLHIESRPGHSLVRASMGG